MKNISLYLLLFTLSSSLIFLGFASEGLSLEDKGKNNKLFQEFLESFPELDLPYEITAETLQPKEDKSELRQNDRLTRIPTKFGAFIPGASRASFSRRPSPSFHVEGKFKQNDEFAAIIYKIVPPFSHRDYNSIEYVLATYNIKDDNLEPHQRMISSIVIGKMNADMHTCKIDKDLNVEMKLYKRDFKEANGTPAEKAFATKTYSISETGTAKKTSEPVQPKLKGKPVIKAKKPARAN